MKENLKVQTFEINKFNTKSHQIHTFSIELFVNVYAK